MKKVNKLVAALLAFVMAVVLGMPALAAGSGSITVDNPQPGQDYTAYKIFDVTYNEDKSAYSYTIDGDSEWIDVIADANESGVYVSTVQGLTLTKAAGANSYVVTVNDLFNPATFSGILKGNVEGKTGSSLTLADGKASITGLDLGYYFVTSTNGSLCNLTTTNPDATIHDKNDIPFEKEDDQEDVEIGNTVNYTITGKVPDTTGFETYTYKITDTMSEGLTFNKDITVTVGGVDVTDDCTITFTPNEENATGFELSIPVKNYTFGAAIEVTYSAVVNENAVSVISQNEAKLEYTNHPDGSTETTPPDIETVYSAKIVINKVDGTDESIKLEGAQFRLFKMVDETKLYYAYDGNKVTWVEDADDATVMTTDENGTTSFIGLADGDYQLEEIVAPNGYNLLDHTVSLTIDGKDGLDNIVVSQLTHTEKVLNNKGTQLPGTGGIGTTIFYIVGAGLMIGAAVLLITRKKMSKGQK